MAGSFNVFRRYQKTALAGLAIMAMLAFFVLPPLLQMGESGFGPGDHIVVRWNGGSLRKSSLERAVFLRKALNKFLVSLRAEATGEQGMEPPLLEDEKTVVDTILMAQEAEANGIVVSDTVINDFLGMLTENMVTPEQIQGIIAGYPREARITETALLDALRDVILGQRLQVLFLGGTGFASAPPGWRWDAFRKLEQSATVEVVPVVVESLSGEVPAPSNATLEKLYAQYASDLPRARSTTPGFREPARVRYDALIAGADLFVAEAEAAVTDEEIAKFYEENKEDLFKKESQPSAGDGAAKEVDAAEPVGEDAREPGAEKTQDANAPASTAPSDKPAPPSDDAPAKEEPAKDNEASSDDGAAIVSGSIRQVAFRQPDGGLELPAETPPGTPVPDSEGGDSDGGASAKADKDPPLEFEPLDKVRDDIRKQLARQAADRKLVDILGSVTARIAGHSDDVELAIGLGERVPPTPDVMKIAADNGLEGLRSDFVTPAEAAAAGGIGRSFTAPARGMRPQLWASLVPDPAMPRFRPVFSRDIAGVRYLSWKVEDRPQFTPPLSEIKPEVERVWKLLEARPLAKKRAEEIVAAAKDKTLGEAVAGREGTEATTVGPFTWLTRGTAPFGSPPTLSDPDGIEMAGEKFMETVFSLEPGETAVAFNEPETVCYAIRLLSFEPQDETLRERFRDSATDPRRLATLAEGETLEVYERWLADVESRSGVTWVRAPR